MVLVGPDGAGKSTVADQLAADLAPAFRRVWHYHWRPMLLPSPGRLRRGGPRDVTRPHEDPPHPRVVSLALLVYYWLDFLLGYTLRWWPARRRGDLVLLERGWYDMAVDPRRYRLAVAPGMVTLLGRLVPTPDVRFVLDGSAEVLHARKPELAPEELDRQLGAWRRLADDRPDTRRVDVDDSLATVVATIRDVTLATAGRHEPPTRAPEVRDWVALPSRGRPRIRLPRTDRRAAREGLRVYQPTAGGARLATAVTRVAVGAGALRLLPSEAIPPVVADRLAPHVPRGGTYALLRSNHPGRFVARLLDHEGHAVAVAKVVDDDGDAAALRHEAAALRDVAPRLPGPVRAPRVLASTDRVLVLEAVTPRPRRRPWVLPVPVASTLGALFASGPATPASGPAMGDCAPWNLLRTADGWVLIDWEHSRPDGMPFADVVHFLVQGHAMVGHPTRDELLGGVFEGTGWIGAAVHAYATAADLDPTLVGASLRAYLSSPNPIVRPPSPGRPPEGQAARRALLDALP